MKIFKNGTMAVMLYAMTLGIANADLIGVSASAPDYQFLNSTLNYNATTGLLSVAVTVNTDFSNNPSFIDEDGNPYDDLGAFLATPQPGPDNFNLFLDFAANYDTTTGAFNNGNVTITGNINYGGLDFGSPPPAAPAVLLEAPLDLAGFDFTNPSNASLDYLGSGLSGEMAGLFDDELGVIITNLALPNGFLGFASGVDIVNASVNVDVTTPPPAQVPAPATWALMLVGVAVMRRTGPIAKHG